MHNAGHVRRLAPGSCHTIRRLGRVFGVSSVEADLDVDYRLDESFDAFYVRERRPMVALAYSTSGSRLAAEDIAHDAFTAAYRDWERVSQLDNPATWVRRIVINKSVSAVRTRVREAKALGRIGGRRDESLLPELSPEVDGIWTVVRQLPKRQRQVVALRYVTELSLSQIAEVLGCSKGTVNTHLRRARAEVSQRLGIEEMDL